MLDAVRMYRRSIVLREMTRIMAAERAMESPQQPNIEKRSTWKERWRGGSLAVPTESCVGPGNGQGKM
jgi:hypothetical protein